jgi:DNA-binding response OmpR family regulator
MANKFQHILAVDDDPLILELIKRIFEESEYKITTLEDGEKVLDVIAISQPDLVLLDVRMPGLSGYEVLHRIRKKYQVPVLLVSGMDEPISSAENSGLSANDYIKKPFTPTSLLNRVEAKLKSAR